MTSVLPSEFEESRNDPLIHLRKQLEKVQSKQSAKHKLAYEQELFITNVQDLCGGILNYVDRLKNTMADTQAMLDITLEHSTSIENELSKNNDMLQDMWKQFEYLFNSSNDGIALLDSNGRIASINDALCHMFGKTKADMLGQSVSSYFKRTFYTNGIKPLLVKAFSGEQSHVELSYDFPKVGLEHVDLILTPFTNPQDEITHVVAIIRDISKAKETRTKLKEQTTFLQSVSDAVVVLDSQGKIQYWSPSAETLYGYTRKEVVGKKASTYLALKGRKKFFKQIIDSIDTTKEWYGELEQTNKSGDTFYVESRWELIEAEKGDPQILITNTDITEKKALETNFIKVQRLETIGAMAGGIAHDLNNVLALFFLSIRVLRSKIGADDHNDKVLNLMESSAKRGEGLVRQIMSFIKGTGGEQHHINIEEFIDEFEVMTEEAFPKNISFKKRLEPDIWPVFGNSIQLHQVLLNLCINARDAMAKKGGVITLGIKNVELDSAALKELGDPILTKGRYVEISIKDTGKGIKKEHLEKIFTPFFTTKSKEKGTGLGLPTVQSIIRNHKGYLEVKSTLNRGTTFIILLPTTKID